MPKIRSLGDLEAELKDVASGKKNAPLDAAEPSYESWEAVELQQITEEEADLIAYDRAVQADEEAFPIDFVRRLTEGTENRVKLWREYRGFTKEELATTVDCDVATITAIEGDHMSVSMELLKNIAAALSIDLDDLLETGE